MSRILRDVLRRSVLYFLVGYSLIGAASEIQPKVLGPDGGDVRSLAGVPGNSKRIFLGTSSGRMFLSEDGGATWQRFAQFGQGFDYVLDQIVVDPADTNVMYVAAWSIEKNSGELFKSRDGGKKWASLSGMQGQSIRALALAPSNSKLLIAGTLQGVFRSTDAGESWSLISPPNHPDIKNIESIAIDPRNPAVIYAGTWHLPWKTADGGATWQHMDRGIIDDSDVFSIIVDPNQPEVIYASACSGIYKSESAGDQFHKIQGIPATARRTRVLKQDPNHSNIVYAGTTQGLWKTIDSGRTWTLASTANLIVNDVFVDPSDSDKVLLATDRSGVLVSRDRARTWTATNSGFSHRQVASVLVDRSKSSVMYAGVVNDKEFGGVFVSQNMGSSWTQSSRGLAGHDVFVLAQDTRGKLIAGTEDNLFSFSPSSGIWIKQPIVRGEKVRVTDLDVSGRNWLAASTSGLFYSANAGVTWKAVPQTARQSLIAVRAQGQVAAAATSSKVFLSADGGSSWSEVATPLVSYIQSMALDGSENVWIATPQGTFRRTASSSWEKAADLPRDVATLLFDNASRSLYAIAGAQKVYVNGSGDHWQLLQTSVVPLRRLTSTDGRIFAGTRFDGVVELEGDMSRRAELDHGKRGGSIAGRP
ncbi:MAG TPA: hypothetical protein VG892_08720 [Terriglobales bacterium]|nr:hypothetical protein [Terriglobales bacterium]